MAQSGRRRPCSDCWNWFSCCSYGENMEACQKNICKQTGKTDEEEQKEKTVQPERS